MCQNTASYKRLLDLTKFCEKWILSVGANQLDDDQWDHNLDSDDEKFDSTAALPRRKRDNPVPEPVIEAKVDEDSQDVEMGVLEEDPPVVLEADPPVVGEFAEESSQESEDDHGDEAPTREWR